MAAAVVFLLFARHLSKNPAWVEDRKAQQINSGTLDEDATYPTTKQLRLAAYFFAACCLGLSFKFDQGQSTTDLVAVINSQKSSQQQIEQAENKLLKRHFKTLSGVPFELSRAIEGALHHPDSFKPYETRYVKRANGIAVTVKYRAKNAVGAIVTEYIEANLAWDGTVREMSTGAALP